MAADVRFAYRVLLPAMYQNWKNLTFLHWPYPSAAITPFLPERLQVDTFEGSAWIGITPFLLTGLRPSFLPALPWLSHFAETNLRTYVTGPDGPGVWFFSLDTSRAPAVMGARLAFGLPYMWSRMRIEFTGPRLRYQSVRRWPFRPAHSTIEVHPDDLVRPDALTRFLTERYRLYSQIGRTLSVTRVQHRPWPLHAAQVLRAEQSLTRSAGLPDPAVPPLVHFSPGVAVRIAAPERI